MTYSLRKEVFTLYMYITNRLVYGSYETKKVNNGIWQGTHNDIAKVGLFHEFLIYEFSFSSFCYVLLISKLKKKKIKNHFLGESTNMTVKCVVIRNWCYHE